MSVETIVSRSLGHGMMLQPEIVSNLSDSGQLHQEDDQSSDTGDNVASSNVLLGEECCKGHNKYYGQHHHDLNDKELEQRENEARGVSIEINFVKKEGHELTYHDLQFV
jgi:hypothetical protein